MVIILLAAILVLTHRLYISINFVVKFSLLPLIMDVTILHAYRGLLQIMLSVFNVMVLILKRVKMGII